MITEPRVWLPSSRFALARLELVIERFERREAARLQRSLVGLPTPLRARLPPTPWIGRIRRWFV